MKIKESFVKRKIGDKYLVVAVGAPSDGSMFIELNETSSDIWDDIEKGLEVPEITAHLCRKYTVDPERARLDVEKLIASMRNEGVLED